MRIQAAGRVLVDIMTTGGPSTIRHLDFDDEAMRSAMVLFDQNHVRVGVDSHFPAFADTARKFLRSCGIDHPRDSLILEVERDIDAGASWQLGLVVALMARGLGCLVHEEEEADTLLLVTGRMGTARWAAKPVEGITRKFDTASARIAEAEARGLSILALMPRDNMEEARRACPPGVDLISVDEACSLVAADAATSAGPNSLELKSADRAAGPREDAPLGDGAPAYGQHAAPSPGTGTRHAEAPAAPPAPTPEPERARPRGPLTLDHTSVIFHGSLRPDTASPQDIVAPDEPPHLKDRSQRQTGGVARALGGSILGAALLGAGAWVVIDARTEVAGVATTGGETVSPSDGTPIADGGPGTAPEADDRAGLDTHAPGGLDTGRANAETAAGPNGDQSEALAATPAPAGKAETDTAGEPDRLAALGSASPGDADEVEAPAAGLSDNAPDPDAQVEEQVIETPSAVDRNEGGAAADEDGGTGDLAAVTGADPNDATGSEDDGAGQAPGEATPPLSDIGDVSGDGGAGVDAQTTDAGTIDQSPGDQGETPGAIVEGAGDDRGAVEVATAGPAENGEPDDGPGAFGSPQGEKAEPRPEVDQAPADPDGASGSDPEPATLGTDAGDALTEAVGEGEDRPGPLDDDTSAVRAEVGSAAEVGAGEAPGEALPEDIDGIVASGTGDAAFVAGEPGSGSETGTAGGEPGRVASVDEGSPGLEAPGLVPDAGHASDAPPVPGDGAEADAGENASEGSVLEGSPASLPLDDADGVALADRQGEIEEHGEPDDGAEDIRGIDDVEDGPDGGGEELAGLGRGLDLRPATGEPHGLNDGPGQAVEGHLEPARDGDEPAVGPDRDTGEGSPVAGDGLEQTALPGADGGGEPGAGAQVSGEALTLSGGEDDAPAGEATVTAGEEVLTEGDASGLGADLASAVDGAQRGTEPPPPDGRDGQPLGVDKPDGGGAAEETGETVLSALDRAILGGPPRKAPREVETALPEADGDLGGAVEGAAGTGAEAGSGNDVGENGGAPGPSGDGATGDAATGEALDLATAGDGASGGDTAGTSEIGQEPGVTGDAAAGEALEIATAGGDASGRDAAGTADVGYEPRVTVALRRISGGWQSCLAVEMNGGAADMMREPLGAGAQEVVVTPRLCALEVEVAPGSLDPGAVMVRIVPQARGYFGGAPVGLRRPPPALSGLARLTGPERAEIMIRHGALRGPMVLAIEVFWNGGERLAPGGLRRYVTLRPGAPF